MRELRKYGTAEQILALSQEELALAVIEAMQERSRDRTRGMANRKTIELPEVFERRDGRYDPQGERKLREDVERALRKTYRLLEERELIEADSGINGENGFIVLTAAGAAIQDRVDLEQVRRRAWLQRDMLHTALQGKPYEDFANGHLGEAVYEAFKTVEIAVRDAAGYPDTEFGQSMMMKAFAENGPLSLPGEPKTQCDSLAKLFAGAMGRFRNKTAHTRPTYANPLIAIEELMLASRLLRIVDEPGRR